MVRWFVLLTMIAAITRAPVLATAQECSCNAPSRAARVECVFGYCNDCCDGDSCCGFLGGDFWTRPRLFGDLFGPESRLAEHGISTNVILGQYYQGVTSGGNEQLGAYGGKMDYYVTYGGEKSHMPTGLSWSLHAESRFGQDISAAAGALVLPNAPLLWPLPGDYHGTNITSLLLTQSLFDGKVDAFFGKVNALDLVGGFFSDLQGGREGFLNVNALVTAMPWFRWVNLSMWGGGAWTIKDEQVQGGFLFFSLDNVSTNWDFSPGFDDGVGLFGFYRWFYEIGDKPGYFLLCVGGSTRGYASLDPTDWVELPGAGLQSTAQRKPWDIAPYLYQVLWQDSSNKNRRIQLFGGGTIADDNPSFSNWNAFGSIEAFGLLPSRPADRMGIAGWYNGISNDFIDLTADLGIGVQDTWGLEMYYNREMTPWFHLTGDMQLFQNDNPDADFGIALGLRAIIDL
jgi:porin